MQDHLKHEINNIISGKSRVRFGELIQAIASYLNDGSQAGSTIEEAKLFQKQEAKKLEYLQ